MLGPSLLLFFALARSPLDLAGAMRAELGLEYDSNANRAPSDGGPGLDAIPRGGPLLRGLFTGQIQYAGKKQRLRGQIQVGGKLFLLPSVQDQNVGVISANYDHAAQLGRMRIGAIIDYYDAYQAPAAVSDSRDFRSLFAAWRLGGVTSGVSSRRQVIDAGIDLGGQYFSFKPDTSYTFLAPALAARLGTSLHVGDPDLGHDFDFGIHLRTDYRTYLDYLGYRYGRTEFFVQPGAQITWQGPILLQLGYTTQLVYTRLPENLPDESYQRHLILSKLAFRVPGDFYLTLKAQMSLLRGGLTMPLISNIDDDYHSLALLDVERPLPLGFAWTMRYSAYFSLPGDTSGQYQRHTIYVGFNYARKLKSQKPRPEAQETR